VSALLKLPGIKQTKKPHAQAWGFLLSAVQEKRCTAALRAAIREYPLTSNQTKQAFPLHIR
ncbi:hypothetical protein, partial [Raoultella sp. 10-1]|uniref:hypothetical protein n=1 Tax=Raoultella sp. 10-1 TaxID=2683201 RepID=UPI001CB8CF38